jgi:hypothetical protein
MFLPLYRIKDSKSAVLCALIVLAFACPGQIWGQGIERQSLAGQDAATAAQVSNPSEQPYNLSLGPVTIRAEAGLSTAYNDNINVAYTGRQGDFIVTPSMTVHALWQATEVNALTLDLGIGYQWYTIHSGDSSINISPNSQTQFNIYVGDFKINLHDQFSFSQNPVIVGQLSNVNQFPVFDNVVGMRVDWDLGDIILSLGYDHTNQWVFDSAFSYLDYQEDSISPRLTVNVSSTIQAGLDTSFSQMRYEQGVQNNSISMLAGPFVQAKINEDLAVDAHAGVDLADYATGGSNGDSSNITGFYGNAGINHRINDVLSEGLTAGQEFLPGVTSNYTKRIYANYNLSWQATNNFTVNPNLWWENLDDSQATNRQTANRFGADLTLSYNINERVTTSLSYQYVIKNANPSSDGYSQDVVNLSFTYKF